MTIWENSLLRRQNKPIWDKTIVNSNMNRIIDIVHPMQQRFLRYEELADTYGLVFSVLWYFSILATLEKHNKEYYVGI